jgi:hypothetical protein
MKVLIIIKPRQHLEEKKGARVYPRPFHSIHARVFQRAAEMAPTVCRRIADEIELWKISGDVGLSMIWE